MSSSQLTNVERETLGLAPLTLTEGLTEIAAIRTAQITALCESAVLNEYERKQPNGTSYSTLLDGKYQNFAENYTAGSSAPTPADAVNEWIHSQKHRDNILNATYKKLGVGYNYVAQGSDSALRYYWEQLFADSVVEPEKVTVSTVELLTANIATDTMASKFIPSTVDADELSNNVYGATIQALEGNDTITNTGAIVSISTGEGNDSIRNSGANATINAGLGNDRISLANDTSENVIEYRAGDGSDTISGFNATDKLRACW